MQPSDQDTPKHFLREWRMEKGIGQRELAEKAGTFKSIISRIETGKHSIDYKLWFRLCWALGIEPGQLFKHPKRKSLDALLRDESDEKVERIAEIVASLRDSVRD